MPKKNQWSEVLPSTSDTLTQHIKQANNKAYVSNSWYKETNCYLPTCPDDKRPSNKNSRINDVPVQKIYVSCNCSCSGTGLWYTESCLCMADEEACKCQRNEILHKSLNPLYPPMSDLVVKHMGNWHHFLNNPLNSWKNHLLKQQMNKWKLNLQQEGKQKSTQAEQDNCQCMQRCIFPHKYL